MASSIGTFSIRHWFKDGILGNLLRNSGLLAGSKAVTAAATLGAMALAARALGVEQMGPLILIHSYAQAASAISHFQSWQVVVRYGGPALVNGDSQTFKRSISFALALDLSSGTLGMIAAMLLLPLLGAWLGVSRGFVTFAILYCLVIPTMGAATPTGILRALDRFDLISVQGPVTAFSRLLLAGLAYLRGGSLPLFAAIWFVTDLLGDLYLWVVALRELRRKSLLKGIAPSLSSRGLPGGWKFATSVNVTASVNAIWGPLTRLLIGGLLSPAATSLYRVASSLSDAAQSPVDLLSKALHPELMRLDPGSKKPWKLMARTMVLSGCAALVLLVLVATTGRLLLLWLFGPDFVPAYSVLLVLMALPLLAVLAAPLPAMLYSLGKLNVPLVANIIGIFVYLAALSPLAHSFGLTGAGAAFVLGRAALLAAMSWSVGRAYASFRLAKTAA